MPISDLEPEPENSGTDQALVTTVKLFLPASLLLQGLNSFLFCIRLA